MKSSGIICIVAIREYPKPSSLVNQAPSASKQIRFRFDAIFVPLKTSCYRVNFSVHLWIIFKQKFGYLGSLHMKYKHSNQEAIERMPALNADRIVRSFPLNEKHRLP